MAVDGTGRIGRTERERPADETAGEAVDAAPGGTTGDAAGTSGATESGAGGAGTGGEGAAGVGAGGGGPAGVGAGGPTSPPPPDAGFAATLRALRAAQKPGAGVSLYSRWVNRPLGRVCAAAAHRVGLRPHQVTAVSALFTYTAIVAIAVATPSWPLAVAVWAGLVVGFALDSADGQLARLQGASSPAGEWLDHVVDCVKVTALHSAVLISFYRFGELPHDVWLLVPLAFQLAAVTTYCGGLLTEKLKPRARAAAAANRRPSPVRAVALLPVDYGVVCVAFLLLGHPTAFRTAYAFLTVAAVLMLGAFLIKWYRELAHPAPAARLS